MKKHSGARKIGDPLEKNTDPTLRFDAFIFWEIAIAAITIKKLTYATDENVFVEKLFTMKSKHSVRCRSPSICSARALDTHAERVRMAPVIYLSGYQRSVG
jgi:hypothetical protein